MSSQTVNPEIVVSQQTEILPEKRAENATHEANGKFARGNKCSPGRPRSRHIKEAFERILETEGADKYARVVTSIALKGKRQADRLAAVWGIRDTTEGKPLQAMVVGHVLDQTSINVVAELLGKLNIQPALEEGDE